VPPGRHPPAPGSSIVAARASMFVWSGSGLTFGQLASSSPSAAFHPRGSPAWIEAIHPAFDSPASCEVDGILRSGCNPGSLRLSQRPLASIRHQVPRIHRSTPLPGLLCGRAGWAELSPAFAGSPSVLFILAETRPLIEASRHYFRSFRPASCDRVLGKHATPFPPGGKVPPGRHHPAPGSYCNTHRFPGGPFA